MSSINTILLQAASESDEVKAYDEAINRSFSFPASDTSVTSDDLALFCGERVRVHIEGRKMSVPGRLQGMTLVTNWGLELDLSNEKVTRIDRKNADTGRWVEVPVAHSAIAA